MRDEAHSAGRFFVPTSMEIMSDGYMVPMVIDNYLADSTRHMFYGMAFGSTYTRTRDEDDRTELGTRAAGGLNGDFQPHETYCHECGNVSIEWDMAPTPRRFVISSPGSPWENTP